MLENAATDATNPTYLQLRMLPLPIATDSADGLDGAHKWMRHNSNATITISV